MEDYRYLNKNNQENILCYKDDSYFKEKELTYSIIENGVVLPGKRLNGKLCGGIVRTNGEYIRNTNVHAGFGSDYEVPEEKIIKSDDKVIYLGMFITCWGHCITDNIRRLWFLQTTEYKERYRDYKLVFAAEDTFVWHPNFKQVLKILGVDYDDLSLITETTQFQTVILPDESFWYDEEEKKFCFTTEYRQTINAIREYGNQHKYPTGYEKIYFSDAGVRKDKQVGEEDLEKIFESQGFKIIYPMDYDFFAELNILMNCKTFAATIGSVSHNSVFLNDNCSVILIPRADYFTGYQIAINQVWDCDVTYIDASLSFLTNPNAQWAGPFYYVVSEQLLDYFNLKKEDYLEDKYKRLSDYIGIGIEKPYLYQSDSFAEHYRIEILDCISWLLGVKVDEKISNGIQLLFEEAEHQTNEEKKYHLYYQAIALSIVYLNHIREDDKENFYENIASKIKKEKLSIEKCSNNFVGKLVELFAEEDYDSKWYELIKNIEKQLDLNSSEILENVSGVERIIIWGNGVKGQIFQRFCKNHNLNNVAIVDQKNCDIGKTTNLGYVIIHTDDVNRLNGVIIATNNVIYDAICDKYENQLIVNLDRYIPFG